jgi:hypothetical protein
MIAKEKNTFQHYYELLKCEITTHWNIEMVFKTK